MRKSLPKAQRGASFTSWVAIVGLLIFAFVTGVKLMPVYLEYYSVRSMLKDIAGDTSINNTSGLRRKIDDYLNVNSLYTIQSDYFTVVTLPEKQNAKALAVNYEVRKPWFGNIDFLLTFKHAEELKGQ